MPKIPIYQTQEKIPDRAGSPEAAGLGLAAAIRSEEIKQRGFYNFQRSLSDVSDAMGQVVRHEEIRQQKVKEAEQAMEHIEKSSRITRTLADLGEKYEADQDWKTKPERFQKEARAYIDEEIKNTADPVVSRMLRKDSERLFLHHELAIRHSAGKQRIDNFKATGLAALEDYEREEARAPDDLAREIIRGKRKASVAGMIEAGVITAAEGQKLDQTLDERQAANQVIQAMRHDPQGVLGRLHKGEFENLTPEKREQLIGAAQRQIEAQQNKAEREFRQMVTLAERSERMQAKAVKETQQANFGKLAAGQTRGRVTLADIDKAMENRQIDEVQYKQLSDRYHRDVETQIHEAEKFIDQSFASKGVFERRDNANERFRADLKREVRDRSRAGELPNNVLNEIIDRENKKPKPINSLPTPLFLDGKKDDIGALERAAQATAQRFRDGVIDEATARREAKVIENLKASIRYRDQQKAETETKKPEGSSKNSRVAK